MIDDIGEMIDDFAVTVTRRRFAQGALVSGRFVKGAPTDAPYSCAVVPAPARELLKLPEGMRTQDVKCVYSRTILQTEPADEITHNGIVYEVFKSEDWNDQGLFFVSFMVKKSKQNAGAFASTLNPATQAGSGNVA